MHIEIKTTNLHGYACGESHHLCRWPDAMVERAKVMGAEGVSVRAIAAELQGPHYATVYRWIAGQRRRPPVRRIARRVQSR